MSAAAAVADAGARCPICGGSGEVLLIDEAVGCQVPSPCWCCQRDALARPGAAAPADSSAPDGGAGWPGHDRDGDPLP